MSVIVQCACKSLDIKKNESSMLAVYFKYMNIFWVLKILYCRYTFWQIFNETVEYQDLYKKNDSWKFVATIFLFWYLKLCFTNISLNWMIFDDVVKYQDLLLYRNKDDFWKII